MVASRDFYEALGYLSYAICGADANIEKEELLKLGNILLTQFGGADMQTKGIRAISRFEMLVSELSPTEDAYNKSLEMFELSKPETRQYKGQILTVLNQLASADKDVEAAEQAYIKRFTNDIEAILN